MSAGWTARTTAALAVAAAVLSGCSDEQPANDTLPEPTAEASETADALPPLGPPDFPVPDEAREKTPEGALAFAEYYIGLSQHIATGSVDPQILVDFSSGCHLCEQVAASYRDDRLAGYLYRGFSFTFREYALPRLEGDSAEVGFVYSQSAYTVVDSRNQGVPVRSVEATGDLQSGAFMSWDEGTSSWVVTSLTIG